MIEKLVDFQIKYHKLLFIFILLFTVYSANIALNLEIEPSFDVLIPDTGEYNTNADILKRGFSPDGAVVVLLSLDDTTTLNSAIRNINNSRVELYFEELNKVLQESQFVSSITPVTYANDLRSAQVVIRVQEPDRTGGLSEVKQELDSLVDEVGKPVGTTVTLTGFSVLIDRIPTLLIQDNLTTIAITVVVVFLILFWYSRDILFTSIVTAIPVMCIIYLGAMMVTLDIPVTITLAAVGVLVLGLGVDYAIHISIHYSKEIQSGRKHKEALTETLRTLILPISASFITTLSGFAALIFGVAPSSQAQGIVLTLTIVIIYCVSLFYFPILMTQFVRHVNIKQNKVITVLVHNLATLATFQVKYPKTILSIIGIVTLIMMYGASQVQFSTSNSNWIPDDDEVSQSFRELEYSYGGNSDTLSIVLISNKGDLRDIEIIRDISGLLEELEFIDNIDSIRTPYNYIIENPNFEYTSLYEELTDSTAFNSDYTLTTITLSSRNPGQDDAGNSLILKDVNRVIENNPIENVDISMFGNAVRFDELGRTLQADAGITTGVGLALVFLIATCMYASFRVGFLALLPIIIAVIWAVGLMGYFKVPFTSLSTGIISLVLGIGVDFSIHIVDGIQRNVKKMSLNRAVYRTMTTSGKAIILASLTTTFGFFALTFAQLLGTQRLGYSLVFSIISVLIVSILLVPSVMSLGQSRKGKKASN